MADQDPQPQPHSELATFGEELRREREIRGISLKEIADATKISKRFLEAIERNDHKTLPAPVFTRGFIREYARYLGLSSEEIVNRYNYAAAGDDRIEKSAHLERLVPERGAAEKERKPAKMQGIPSPMARVDRNVYVAVIIAIVLVGVTYWAVKHRSATADPVETPAVTHSAPPVAPVAVSTQTTPPAPSAGDALRLTMTFVDDSWVSIEVDGHDTTSFDGRKGEKRTFEAKERLLLKKIGNAAGVELALNDVRIPPLGREGQVRRDLVFDRDYLLKAQSAATAEHP
jgi:cytoskeletal protein RodZ